MQLRERLLAANRRSEDIFLSLPRHFLGVPAETVPAIDVVGKADDTAVNALVLLEYFDAVLEVTPPLFVGTRLRVLRPTDTVRLTEKGRLLVLLARARREQLREAVAS